MAGRGFGGGSGSSGASRRRLGVLTGVLALLAGLLTVGSAVVTAPPAAATHFRAAQLTWQKAASPPRTVNFHFTGSFRRSFFATSGPPGTTFVGPYPYPGPNVGNTVNPDAPIVFGDGQSSGFTGTVQSVDAANDTITVDGHITHTYAGTSPNFLASFERCCRLSAPEHRNNPDVQLRTETVVSFQNGVTASPEGEVSPIVDCPVSALCQFFLPATDADGGSLSWMFATSAQAANATPPFVQPSGASVNPATGLYQWDTRGQSLNPSGPSFFSTQVVIIKNVPGGGSSRTAVDFFLRVTSSASPNRPPTFSGATPADGTVITTPVGTQVAIDTQATDPDTAAVVTLGMLNKPAAATYATSAGNPASGHFTWTPTAVGDKIITITAQDQFGLQATQRSLTIRVGDHIPPVISVPGDISVEATGPSGAARSYTATATDNVDGPITPTCGPPSGSTFQLGITTVTCTATDASGNGASVTFDITVEDTTGPVINGLGNLTVEAQDGTGATVAFAPTATDLVDGDRPVSCSAASGSTFRIGTTMVTCTSTDSRANVSTRPFTVLVQDTTKPILSIPADLTTEATGPPGATVIYDTSAADAVDGAITPACSPASRSVFPIADTTVTCTATDANGNVASGSFMVHVLDRTAPVLTLPGDITVEADGPAGTVVPYTTGATDVVDGSIVPACDAPTGATFPVGITTITCRATDAHGNSTAGAFHITVVDQTPPHLTVPADITSEATGPNGAPVAFQVTATDLVDGPLSPACSPPSGSPFPLGNTTVRCSSTDSHGQTGSASFVVHVVDTTPPALSGPTGLTVEADGRGGGQVPFTVDALDIVDGTVPVTCSPPSGSLFPIGTTIVSCDAADGHGNHGTTTVAVTVVDTTAPDLHLPGDKTVEATGSRGASVSYAATASDIVDGDLIPSCTPPSGSEFLLGHTRVTCSVVDSHGNRTAGTFDVLVDDTTPPAVTVPPDVTVEATGPQGAAASYPPATAHDLVDGDLAAPCDHASGSAFPPGTTVVICHATDAHGNLGQSSFKVVVHDTTAPAVTTPPDVTAEATGPRGASVTYPPATAYDAVDGARPVVCTPSSGTPFALGQTTVTCTAADSAGNVGTGSFSVTVRDTTGPSLSQPGDVVVEATGPAGAAVTYRGPTANDLVDGSVAVSCTPPSGSTFPLGATMVRCSAVDGHGNAGTASFKVTVVDTAAPHLTVPADVVAEATSPAGAPVAFKVSAMDLVDGAVAPLCTPGSGSMFPRTSTTVHCTATDSHGNSATASFTVTVRDTTPPIVSWTGNQGSYAADQVVNITCAATDSGSGVASSTCQSISGPASSFPVGVNTFTATATDRAGNTGSATTSFTVVVTPASLCALTNLYVTKAGVADSLCVKIRNGAAAAGRGDKGGANTDLLNYQNEVGAQSGKSMTAGQAATLIRLAKALAAGW